MLSTRDPPQNKGHIQIESEGLEKDISCKWRPKKKKAGVIILILDKIDFEKGCGKRQRRTLHNDQRINPRRYNDYKYICTQHRSTTTYKANANKYERGK